MCSWKVRSSPDSAKWNFVHYTFDASFFDARSKREPQHCSAAESPVPRAAFSRTPVSIPTAAVNLRLGMEAAALLEIDQVNE